MESLGELKKWIPALELQNEHNTSNVAYWDSIKYIA